MKKKQFAILGLLAFTLASCGKGVTTSAINITIWEDINNHDIVETLLNQYLINYKEKYPAAPELKITLVDEKEGSAISDLSNDGPAGQGPDLFAFVHDTLSSAVTNKLIDENIYAYETRINHSSDAVSAFTYNDKLYGYPITAESLTIMYNKSQLSETDVSSFENLKASGKKVVFEVANSSGSAYYTFGLMNDANLFGENGTDKTQLDFATPNAVQNMTTLAKDYQDVILNQSPDMGLPLLTSNQASAVISSPYLWPLVKEQLGNNAAIATLPTINGQTLRPFSGYKGYGVSRYSKYPYIAHDIAKYLTDEVAQIYRLKQLGLLPTFASERVEQEVAKTSTSTVFQASLSQSLVMPNIVAMGSFWGPMNDAVTSIWNLKTSATLVEVEGILRTATNDIKTQIG